MPHRLIVRKRAQADIDAACAWYESQEQGVGLRFLDEVDAALRLIRDQPEMFASPHRGIRRAILHKFPFGIYYMHRGNTVSVISVVHVARHPRNWPE